MSYRCSSTSSDNQKCGQCSESSKECELNTESGSNSPVIPDSVINLRFPIYVESMTGTTFKLDVFSSDTIRQIKEQLENTEGIPVRQQHLIWQNKELSNENTIKQSYLGSAARLRLVVDLTTGPVSGIPLTLDSRDTRQNSEEESTPLTLLLFQNGDQIKLISITTNKTNVSDKNSSNYFGLESDLSYSPTNQSSDSKEEENRRMNDKMNEIQSKLKSLELKRKEINSNAKQAISRRRNSINSEKLPNLGNICDTSERKQIKNDLSSELHLPPISVDSKSGENLSNESIRLEKQFDFIKQILMPSIDVKTVLYERRHSLTSNRTSLGEEEINRLDVLYNKRDNSISKLRPLTAPADKYVNDNHIYLMNKLSKTKPANIFLSKPQNSAKIIRLKSGQKLPSIVNNSKKKVKKIRCSLCRIKLGIVNRYKCRCGLVFCAKHRYSETHSCAYDYKEEGIKSIRQNNPVIAPEKLPKI